MIKNQSIIGVSDVEASSAWYQKLLGCQSLHGGPEFEILADEAHNIFLCLHKWGTHEHPTMMGPDKHPGNGLIIYLRLDDLDTVWENAQKLEAEIVDPPKVSENSGKKEFSLRDPDGYFLLLSL